MFNSIINLIKNYRLRAEGSKRTRVHDKVVKYLINSYWRSKAHWGITLFFSCVCFCFSRLILASVVHIDFYKTIAWKIIEVRSVCQKGVGVLWEAAKISANKTAIVVKLLGLVVAVARLVNRAAIRCDY